MHSAEIYAAPEIPQIYQKLFRCCNGVMAEMMRALVKSWDPARPLRILEVGAGLGTTTLHLLPLLPHQRTAYAFTDISDFFLQEARRRFAEYPFLQCRLLDLEKNPLAQGFEAQAFDVIVAASVLHDTRSVAETMRGIRSLLAPGGILLIIEETRFFPSYDLSMGLQQGFDRFEDEDLRGDHPLLGSEAWEALLIRTGFEQAATMTQPGSATDFIGFKVMAAQGPMTATQDLSVALRDYLRKKLPAYAVPARFVILDKLPLTANGKVDRKALPGLEAIPAAPSRSQTSPRTPMETRLAAVWHEVLQKDSVSVDDNFFEIGGDSLLLTRVQSKLVTELGRPIPIAELFEFTSIRALAEHFQELATESLGNDSAPKLQRRRKDLGRHRELRKSIRTPGPSETR